MGYPFDAAGGAAPPPDEVPARLADMAARAEARNPATPREDELLGARPWRSAHALDVLFAEADAAAPDRSKKSDGRLGNSAHAALGEDSDHNPWVVHQGLGIVRAGDLTNDPALKLAAAFERLRQAAHAGKLPQVLVGGYAILNGRITAPDWSGWREYTGSSPHILHGHISLSLTPAQFDSRQPWGIFVTPQKAPAKQAPAKQQQAPAKPRPVDVRWLEAGDGHYPEGDPRWQATRNLQRRLQTRFPAYARRLVVDGRYGPATEAAVREFQRRKHLEVTGIAGPLTLSRLGL